MIKKVFIGIIAAGMILTTIPTVNAEDETKYVERPIAMTIGLFLKEGGYYEGSNNYYCFNANWCINRCFHNVLFTN